MMGIGTTEMILIGFVIILFFGSKKLPDLARGIGQGIKEFKNASKTVTETIDSVTAE